MSAADARATAAFVPMPATWYGWLLIGAYIYSLNLQGNVVSFLQDEFGLSYRAVALHSSAIAVGNIVIGLFGNHLIRRIGRRRTLWLSVAGFAACQILLCLASAPWASIGSCFLIGVFGTMIPAVVPALLADIHGEHRAEAYAGQSIAAYVFGLAAPLLTGFFVWQGLGWRAAVISGAVICVAIGLWFRKTALIETAPQTHFNSRRLPPAYWAYWVLLVAACALEFCLLMWAPTFLQQIVGFAPASAATAAAGFPLGMLLGRIANGRLVRRVPPQRLLVAALALTFVGFLVYWGTNLPAVSVVGVFITGLGIAPLFPLVTTLAVGAALEAKDLASVRFAIAFGVSLLLAPIALGALADEAGLVLAHLALPALIVVAYASFFIATALQKRSAIVPAA